MFKYDGKDIYQGDVYAADSTVFELFTFPFLEGEPSTALTAPNSVVLTKSLAERVFGDEPALGKLIGGSGEATYKVTGVMEDTPHNTHLNVTALFSLDDREKNQGSWGAFYVLTYFLLPENYDISELNAQMPAMYDKYMKDIFSEIGIDIEYEFQPLTKIHLYSQIEGEAGGDIQYVYIFIAVAVFMLLIASINYTNLATARSVYRAKEVGVRKVMGAMKGQLMTQFLAESLVLTFSAAILSLLLLAIGLPFFNEVSGKEIGLGYLLNNYLPYLILAVVLFLGILGGGYPAFVLSSFKPVTVLKGKLMNKGGNVNLRKGLVILQFSVSLVMLVCTKIVYDQLAYMQSKDLGYDREQVMTFRMPRGQARVYEVLKNELSGVPSILGIGAASSTAGNIDGRNIFNIESAEGMDDIAVKPFAFDHDYINTMGMEIVLGRNFSADYPADTLASMLVNETTVKRLNWEEPLGKKIRLGGTEEKPNYAQVVGVVKDFHPVSLYEKIEPMVMIYDPGAPVVHVKVEAKDIATATQSIEKAWKKNLPGYPFEYNFLDQDFLSNYETDINRGKVFTVFSVLTIIIACLGLLGLSSYTAEHRSKEISVRKVIGASIAQIIVMMTKDFVVLVLVSLALAFPIAWYFMDQWLAIFAYRTEIHFISFVIAGLLTLIITLLTVSYHTIKAATINPVDSLRSE